MKRGKTYRHVDGRFGVLVDFSATRATMNFDNTIRVVRRNNLSPAKRVREKIVEVYQPDSKRWMLAKRLSTGDMLVLNDSVWSGCVLQRGVKAEAKFSSVRNPACGIRSDMSMEEGSATATLLESLD